MSKDHGPDTIFPQDAPTLSEGFLHGFLKEGFVLWPAVGRVLYLILDYFGGLRRQGIAGLRLIPK